MYVTNILLLFEAILNELEYIHQMRSQTNSQLMHKLKDVMLEEIEEEWKGKHVKLNSLEQSTVHTRHPCCILWSLISEFDTLVLWSVLGFIKEHYKYDLSLHRIKTNVCEYRRKLCMPMLKQPQWYIRISAKPTVNSISRTTKEYN